MKVKSSALFGLMVVICSISGFSLLKRFTQEVDEWRPSNLYSSTNLTRRSTFSVVSSAPASSSEAVATISSGSESLFGHGGAVLYAPASTPTYGLSPLASSPSGGLYTTSSAELRSFGGGGNGGGVSMSGGSVKSSGPSMASAGLGVSMPSTSVFAYNTKRNNSTASDVMSSVPGDIAMASTQAYAGIGYTTGGASRGISGRRDAVDMGGLLDDWVQGFIGNDDYWYTVNGINYFDYAKLRELYNAAIANGELPKGVSWEMFLSWFSNQSDYAFPIPSGVWCMCILALGYGLYIAYRKKQKVVNS